MSRMTQIPRPQNDETRLAMAAAAAGAERANQPRYLVLVAGVLLAAALLFVGLSYRASRDAAEQARDEEAAAMKIVTAAARFKALREAGTDAGPAVAPGHTQVLSRIQNAGVDAGLSKPVPLPIHRPQTPSGGSVQHRFECTVEDDSLPALFDWMQRAIADVPGLEVYSLTLRPDQNKKVWALRVTFALWQKTEGT
jgi:hypothetical protein